MVIGTCASGTAGSGTGAWPAWSRAFFPAVVLNPSPLLSTSKVIGSPGGAYIVYCVKSMHVTNNVFGNYVYGPATGNCGIWSGNVWEKDGKPVIH